MFIQIIYRGIMQGGSGVADQRVFNGRKKIPSPAILDEFTPGFVSGDLHRVVGISGQIGIAAPLGHFFQIAHLGPTACAVGIERRGAVPGKIAGLKLQNPAPQTGIIAA